MAPSRVKLNADDHGRFTEYYHDGKVFAEGPRAGSRNIGHWRFLRRRRKRCRARVNTTMDQSQAPGPIIFLPERNQQKAPMRMIFL